MSQTLPPTSQQISDNAERLSKLAFAAQGLGPYDQDNEEPEPKPVTDEFNPAADTKRFLSEFFNETGLVNAVDTGRTALKTEISVEYVPTETPVDVQVAA
jgi:transcription antitermination factor NusG